MVVAVLPAERCNRQILPGANPLGSRTQGFCGGATIKNDAVFRSQDYCGGRHMSTTGIGNLLGSSSAEAVYKVGLGSNTIRTRSDSSDSGDTVDISDEAKKLFSEKIHMYDKGSSTTATSQSAENKGDTSAETADGETGEAGGGGSTKAGGAGGGGGNDSSSDPAEKIKKQIAALKSQLSSLASHAGSGTSAAVESKIQSLESQIAALEAQLAEAESTSA